MPRNLLKGLATATLLLGAASANGASAAIITLTCSDHVVNFANTISGQKAVQNYSDSTTLAIDLSVKEYCWLCKGVWKQMYGYDDRIIVLWKYEVSSSYLIRQTGEWHITNSPDPKTGWRSEDVFHCSAPKL